MTDTLPCLICLGRVTQTSSIEKNLATVPSSIWRAVLPSSPKELVTHLDSWWVFQWIVQLECFRVSSSLGRISTPKRCFKHSNWLNLVDDSKLLAQDLAFLSNLFLIFVHSFAGYEHTVLLLLLLRSHGAAVACGNNEDGQCTIPPLGEGMSYTQVSAGGDHTVLLRSDGTAVACGHNEDGQCTIPPLDEGMSYTQVSAGGDHAVLLRSDSTAVACGNNEYQQCTMPHLGEGMSYTQVSAGGGHTVLRRSDGTALACWNNEDGQCDIPPLDEGISYTQVSAGDVHTVFLRSDGTAVACGANDDDQCNIPTLDKNISYTEVSAGEVHTVLLQSDGAAVACGDNPFGQCNIPSLKTWRELLSFAPRRYTCHDRLRFSDPVGVLQLDLACQDDALMLTCSSLAGHEVLSFAASGSDLAVDTHRQIAQKLDSNLHSVRVVLPDGQLLTSIYQTNLDLHYFFYRLVFSMVAIVWFSVNKFVG